MNNLKSRKFEDYFMRNHYDWNYMLELLDALWYNANER